MKKNLLFLPFVAIIIISSFISCEANDEDFGNERVYLTKNVVAISVESSFLKYNSEPDPTEPVEKIIYVAGVAKSGYLRNPSSVDVEMEVDPDYVETLLEELADPDAQLTEELEHLEGGMILPEDCYTIESLNLQINSDEYVNTLPVKLNMEKVKALNPYVKWILPAFKIKSASIEVNDVIEHTIVTLNFIYTDAKPTPDPLPEDLSGWTNLIYKLPKEQIQQCRWWSSETSHNAAFTVDGDKDINAASNRWVPFSNYGATEAPWVEYDLGGTYDIAGLKLFYMNEKEPNQSEPTPRANCYVWAKVDNRWFKQEELLGNTELIPSYQLDIKNATHIRLTWDLIVIPTLSYFMKVKEIEIYKKP